MYNFSILVVIYNQAIASSIALNESLSFVNNSVGSEVIVIDNSTNKQIKLSNFQFCTEKSVKYVDMRGNLGLSKAYNRGISEASNEWIVIFDQDTNISSKYFERLIAKMNVSDRNLLYIPIVKSGDNTISPARLVDGDVVRIKGSFNYEENECYTAINSGMVIHKSVYNYVGSYDENIFLDYIDHNFMYLCNKKNIKPKVFLYICNQNFSGDEKPPLRSALIRFKIYKKDLYYYYKNTVKSKLRGKLKIVKRKFVLTLKYKTLRFIFTK